MSKLRELLNQLLRSQKIILAIAFTFLAISLLITLVVNLLPKESDYIQLENPKILNNISSREQEQFKIQLLKLLRSNNLISNTETVKDILIRENSIDAEEVEDEYGKETITTFLVDIDSLKQTYQVKIYDADHELTSASVVITCPKIKDSKYPDSLCVASQGSSSTNLDLHLPYETSINGKKVIVKDLTTKPSGKTVEIYLYSCDSKNPSLEETEKTIKTWVKNTVKDPKSDSYLYNVRPGYCNGDPI